MDLKAFLWAHFLSYIETAIGMLLKSMFKLFSGFTLAVKLILQIGQSYLLSVLQKICAQTQNKVFISQG